MIKRSLFFSTPGSLRLQLRQLVWKGEDGRSAQIPVEDIGLVLVESRQVSVTSALLTELGEAGATVIFCDASHMPSASLLPMAGNTRSQSVLHLQIKMSAVKSDILWGQTVREKILNQAAVAFPYDRELAGKLREMAKTVKRGDPANLEAQAARAYFSIFEKIGAEGFHRDPEGTMPNAALNYGYAILRAAVARALVSSGLHCAIGIHHHNQFNPFCLADDLMEPYRPFVDRIILSNRELFWTDEDELTPLMKQALLSVAVTDVSIGKMTRPLMNALSLTSASFVRVIGEDGKGTIEYPKVPETL